MNYNKEKLLNEIHAADLEWDKIRKISEEFLISIMCHGKFEESEKEKYWKEIEDIRLLRSNKFNGELAMKHICIDLHPEVFAYFSREEEKRSMCLDTKFRHMMSDLAGWGNVERFLLRTDFIEKHKDIEFTFDILLHSKLKDFYNNYSTFVQYLFGWHYGEPYDIFTDEKLVKGIKDKFKKFQKEFNEIDKIHYIDRNLYLQTENLYYSGLYVAEIFLELIEITENGEII